MGIITIPQVSFEIQLNFTSPNWDFKVIFIKFITNFLKIIKVDKLCLKITNLK